MLELHYPTVTKTILERQYPGKPTLKVAFGNDNGAIFENSSKLRASLFVTSRWPRSSGQTNYQVHHPPREWKKKNRKIRRSRSYPLTRSWALIIGTFLSAMMWREQHRAMWSYKVVFSSFAVLAVLLRIQSKMSLEEEVFKIGKQLEKIVGEEGTVSQWCLLIFYRPVVPRDSKNPFTRKKISILLFTVKWN